MYTIDKPYSFEQIINKSRFICYLFPVDNIDDVNTLLTNIRKKHYDANHNCYSYILGDEARIIKSSDDGEPSQSAGIVIYDVLKKNDLTNILAIVTRYFGGIKLGLGGLIRAYSSSVSLTLKDITFQKIEKMITLHIECDYTYLNIIIKQLSDYQETFKDFSTNIILEYSIPLVKSNEIINNLQSITNNNIIVNTK